MQSMNEKFSSHFKKTTQILKCLINRTIDEIKLKEDSLLTQTIWKISDFFKKKSIQYWIHVEFHISGSLCFWKVYSEKRWRAESYSVDYHKTCMYRNPLGQMSWSGRIFIWWASWTIKSTRHRILKSENKIPS